MKKVAVFGVPGGWSSELLADTVKAETGFRCLVDPETVALDLEREEVWAAGQPLHEMDAVIVKKAGPFYSPLLLDRLEILRYLNKRCGVPIFSDPEIILRVLDRTSCTVTLAAGGIPMPPTALTESVEEAMDFLKRYSRAVFKPIYSTKARGMLVIEHGQPDARARVEAFQEHNPFMYLQQMVRHPGKDLGVAFLGGEYLATYARAGNKDSWNTTTRSGGHYEAYEPDSEVLELAHRAQALFGLDFTSVDVVETPEGPKVFEVSAFGGFRGLRDANGIDAAKLYVDYVLGRIGR
ncbi:GAK system ATP-grasp enzyme [Oceanidesulfovibrio indonesiensis]|uniref:GAK system ATP-grasp enzyme n=1 Tax=Oceanidesulfovibrio indonesiensis TaxID=54767 RepID=A0A7M3MEP5_9BACT|nr:GAK system ATP-grasp enzyme [Oceanidesulfovibrio indonesiensis]TVM17366.1 GAK system ATP-grasp enzyme [Oceanidesulfovibrio indonesiensis]